MKLIASLVLWLLFEGVCVAAGLDDYKSIQLPESPRAEAGKKNLRVMFIGVSTLVFDDGETAIMTDGYFTRPPFNALARIAPDRARITKSLQRAGVKSLAVVIPVHSHFDHALDSPIVAQQTGALLAGSTSTANIGRGYGLPETGIKVVANGETLTFGPFKVTFVPSTHLPINFAEGEITAPLSTPARASDFKMGEVYSLLVEYAGRTILIQGSAGFTPNALNGRKADVVYLGVGGLGVRDEAYQDGFWKENVLAVGARRVIPIHWDNFYRSLDEPLTPAMGFDKTMGGLLDRGKKHGVEVRMQTEWIWVDPYAGMAP